VNESYHTYEPHMIMQADGLHVLQCVLLQGVAVCVAVYERVMSHIQGTPDPAGCVMSHMNDSCHTHTRRHVTQIRNHVTHMNESCHTYE